MAQVEGDGTATGSDLHGHGHGGVVGVGIGAQHGRVALHEGLAFGIDEARAQRHQHGLAFPAEEAGHVPDTGKFQVLQDRAGLIGHLHGLAGRRVLAVRGLPAAHAAGGNDHPGVEAVKIAVDGIEAQGAADAAVLLQQLGQQDASHPLHGALLELAHDVLDHQLAATALELGRVQLHMVQSPLGDVFHAAVFFLEKFAAEAFVVMQTVGRALQDLFHEVLVAEAVEIIDEVLDPLVHVVRGEDGFKVAARHGHQTAPVAGALVHDADAGFRGQFGTAVGGPQAGGTAAHDQDVRRDMMHVHLTVLRPEPWGYRGKQAAVLRGTDARRWPRKDNAAHR